MKIELNLFQRILLNCLIVSSIPLLGFIYQVHLNEAEQTAAVEQELKQTAQVVSSEIENWVDKNIRNASLVASLDAAKYMEADNLVPILKSAKANLDWVSLLFVMDTKGDAIARSDGKPLRNYSDREYVKQVLSGKKMGQQVLIGKVKPVPLHCFSLPITGPQSTKSATVGLITQCSTLTAISQYVADLTIGKTGVAILIDDKNRLIAMGGPDTASNSTLQNFSDHPAIDQQANDQFKIKQHEGREKVMLSRTVGPDWRLIIQQDYDEAFSTLIQGRINTIALVILTVGFTLLISIMTSLKVSTPIKRLTKIADACSRGEFPTKIDESERKDEVGELARAVYRMSKSINLAIIRVKRRNMASSVQRATAQ
ncbi:HAMP domain-containing protein [Sedimenticola sp.]|uniref:HAMP domain-containing protein n=1 Tax=Sedimenticola sp. TaxID=1940285 RepID=UPI003D118FD7